MLEEITMFIEREVRDHSIELDKTGLGGDVYSRACISQCNVILDFISDLERKSCSKK